MDEGLVCSATKFMSQWSQEELWYVLVEDESLWCEEQLRKSDEKSDDVAIFFQAFAHVSNQFKRKEGHQPHSHALVRLSLTVNSVLLAAGI